MAIVAGGETQVNSYTTSDQREAKVAALEGGGWVVTWESWDQDGSGLGVYQQVYNADGTPKGAETRTHTYVSSSQEDPIVIGLDGGGWVVIWQSNGQDGSDYGIYQRAYDADGVALTAAETKVNGTSLASQRFPVVTALDGGGWVVAWQSSHDGTWDVFQQVFDAAGNAQGAETRVNTTTAYGQEAPRITTIEGGGWVVTWRASDQTYTDGDIFQQAYAANGTPVGGETQVNTTTANLQYDSQIVALKDGGWVVSWTSQGQDGSLSGIYQQRYDANGDPVGSETRVNTYTDNEQRDARSTALDGGGWVVTWWSKEQDGSEFGIYQQAFAADGTPMGGEVRVNTHAENTQYASRVVALNNGGWVVTWWSQEQDGDDFGVYQQVFSSTGDRVGEETRVNTSTDGNQAVGEVAVLTDGRWVVTWQSAGGSYDVFQKVFAFANDAPGGSDKTININEDEPYTFGVDDFGFSDVNGDSLLSVIITDPWVNGTLTLDGAEVEAGDEILVADIAAGKLIWTPTANLNGTHLAEIGFRVRDNGGTDNGGQDTDLTPDTIYINVAEVNDVPQATFDLATVTKYASVAGDVVGNDTDADVDTLTVTSVSHGITIGTVGVALAGTYGVLVIEADGTFSYAASNMTAIAVGSTQTDIFSYGISDGNGGASGASLIVSVTGADTGNNDANSLLGSSGNDTLTGFGGNDTLNGADGNDTLIGGAGKDTVLGGAGGDVIEIAGTFAVGDTFAGGAGTDAIKVTGAGSATLDRLNTKTASIEKWIGNGKALLGTAGIDVLDLSALTVKTGLPSIDGRAGNDSITGSKFADALLGGVGNDTLEGGVGEDLLTGGAGADKLEGGTGADRFIYAALADSRSGAATLDTIIDFNQVQRDRIDLSAIDASTKLAGNQRFSFVGEVAFSKKAGELRVFKQSGDTFVEGDVTGDGRADFAIRIDKSLTLKSVDFVL